MVNTRKDFSITGGRGFQLKLQNGVTISVQFGPGNYCEHYEDLDINSFEKVRISEIWQSNNAEIAAWDSFGHWFNFQAKKFNDDCDPLRNQSVSDFIEWLNYLNQLKLV